MPPVYQQHVNGVVGEFECLIQQNQCNDYRRRYRQRADDLEHDNDVEASNLRLSNLKSKYSK